MPEDVKPKRRYRSTRRKAQAEDTRLAILDAARTLFAEKGWSATTIAAIARRAGVAPETVYARFGSKLAIVQALVVFAMRGADQATPFMEQPQRHRVRDEADPSLKIEAFSRHAGSLLARAAPILAVVRSASETDTELRSLYGELHRARRRNLATLVDDISAVGALRPGLDRETAVDHLWSLTSPELYLVWTGAAGRNPADHAEWLAAALKRLLLENA